MTILGQVKRSTVPTEIAVSGTTWTPAGDDASGWLWTSQVYDWKGRVIQEFNTDGTDRLYSYDGCGCAGGQVTTVKSELVPRDDQPTVNARRTQKIYADVLGRSYKTEVLNWDGITPYTTTVQTFNGRDQVVETKQYAGAAVSTNTNQIVSMTYDGHGRMKTRHYPVEDAGTNTTWSYNADDTIQMVIDPRGAITNFSYEAQRGLLTNISYQVPTGSTIPVTPSVSFGYDALGNRTSMDTNGISNITYSYDSLSRMTSETVDFDDLTENFTIGYSYHLGGALKSITDPNNSTVNYTNDKTGRLTAVTGTAWGENTTGNYASGITYRAFGKLKQINYTLPDESPQIKMDYDSRLRISHSEVVTNKMTSGYLMKADFAYSADSRLQAKDDLLDDKWDRTNKYDHAGRLTFNQFGMGEATDYPGTYKRVYEQNIAYDAFSMMTSRWGVHWGNGIGFSESYTNGRINNPNVIYDAAGNIGDSNSNSTNPHEFQWSTFDASGRRTISHSSVKGRWGSIMNMVTEKKDVIAFDGDGHPVVEKSGYQTYHAVTGTPPPANWQPTAGSYRIWSSVLGAGLTTIDVGSDYKETNVYAGKSVIAVKTRGVVNNQTVDQISWKTSDPVTGTEGSFGGGFAQVTEENEPLGQKIDFLDSSASPEPSPSQIFVGSADEPGWRCLVPIDFMPYHCQMKADIANSLNGTSIIVTYDPNKKQGDPNFIHAGEPPREQTAESADDHLMHEILHSTNKPEDLEYGGSLIQSSQLPTQSGNGQPPKLRKARKAIKRGIRNQKSDRGNRNI